MPSDHPTLRDLARFARPAMLAAMLATGVGACALGTGGRGPAPLSDTVIVSNPDPDGSGGLAEAIRATAREDGPRRIRIALPPGTVIVVATELPALTRVGVELDGGGAVLRSAPDCRSRAGRAGCNGLIVEATADIHHLRAEGFRFDGFTVRGARARGTRIHECSARGNLDDGIGIAAGALDVLVEDCVLVGNGFATKGKGVLVFDRASAFLRGNVIAANRDGVTVSRRSRAYLTRNLIVYNWDKGLGARAGTIQGRANVLIGNGASAYAAPAPNGDALRVTLGSTVILQQTTIAGSGDDGIVVTDGSSAILDGGTIQRNAGIGAAARDRSYLEMTGVSVVRNGGGNVVRDEHATLLGP